MRKYLLIGLIVLWGISSQAQMKSARFRGIQSAPNLTEIGTSTSGGLGILYTGHSYIMGSFSIGTATSSGELYLIGSDGGSILLSAGSGSGNARLYLRGYNAGTPSTASIYADYLGRLVFVPASNQNVLIDGNKTTSNLFEIINDNDGAVGDSSVVITSSGNIRQSVTAGLTAVNPGGQGDGALTADINEVSTVGTASDAVTLPTAIAGLEIFIINNGAEILEIWPASGDDLGAGANTATTLAAGANVTFVAYDATNWKTK